MAEENQETEVKFYVRDIVAVKERLQSLGAHLIQPRILEINLRFDTPVGDLAREGRVLRLRRDEAMRLTYKDGTQLKDGVLSRREIEFSVSDFDSAKQFLEALGYMIVFIYEKYRTTYSLPKMTAGTSGLKTRIMLDELPYGNFVEIEGEFNGLRPLTRILRFNWDTAIPASYHSLFDRLSTSQNLPFQDLTFENFKDIKVVPANLGILPADL